MSLNALVSFVSINEDVKVTRPHRRVDASQMQFVSGIFQAQVTYNIITLSLDLMRNRKLFKFINKNERYKDQV